MKHFKQRDVNYIIKDDGKFSCIKNTLSEDNVVHIVASNINEKVVKKLKQLMNDKNIGQVVINRTKLWYSPIEIDRLDRLNRYIQSKCNGNVKLEFLEESTLYDFKEVKKANDKLLKEAKIIRDGFVVSPNGEKRPFSPLEKLYAIHLLVGNNEYKLNEEIDADYTRNLYSVLQDDREGIVCVGYANWFKTLADIVDPRHREFKVENVTSFFPDVRNENLDYEEIIDLKNQEKYYSQSERAYHETNAITLVKDDVYNIEGFYHNDSTFDSIRPDNGSVSFMHFMLPFGGYMKSSENCFIPLRILHPSLSQAKALSNLSLVGCVNPKIESNYYKYLKNPQKKIFDSQLKRMNKILDSQINSIKNDNFQRMRTKEITRQADKEVYEEHGYTSWEEAIKGYINKNQNDFPENKPIFNLYKNGIALPDIKSLDDDQRFLFNLFFSGDSISNLEDKNALKEKFEERLTLLRIDTANVDQETAFKDFIEFNNAKREKKIFECLKDEDVQKILPDVKDLYKEDFVAIINLLTADFSLEFKKHRLQLFLKKEYSAEEVRKNIDLCIRNHKPNLWQIIKEEEKKSQELFKKEGKLAILPKKSDNEDKTMDINGKSMRQIMENVYKYLITIYDKQLKEANFDLTRLKSELDYEM